jgi:hypothetical protein
MRDIASLDLAHVTGGKLDVNLSKPSKDSVACGLWRRDYSKAQGAVDANPGDVRKEQYAAGIALSAVRECGGEMHYKSE